MRILLVHKHSVDPGGFSFLAFVTQFVGDAAALTMLWKALA